MPDGERNVTRVTGSDMSSSHSTTVCSPSSSPSGKGAVTLNPSGPSTAMTASSHCPRSIDSAGAGSNVTRSTIS